MGNYELEWLHNLWIEIAKTSEFPKNYVINLTWESVNEDQHEYDIYAEIENPRLCKFWFVSCVDPLEEKFYQKFIDKGFTVSTVGFSPEHWSSWYPYWVYQYNKDVVAKLDENIKYIYLSYNRKPHLHRYNLVKSLIENNLHDVGHVTYQHGVFPEIDMATGNTETDYWDKIFIQQSYNYKGNPDLRYSRPEDATSLGNLDIWNSAYLNIISETTDTNPYHITEKTYKPIIGLRPFIINGHSNLYNILKKMGFYTTVDFFNDLNLENGSIESIIRLVSYLKTLNKTELYNLYEKQLPLLLANRQRLKEICDLDRTKILYWPQGKKIVQAVFVLGNIYSSNPQEIRRYETSWIENLKNEISIKSIYPYNFLINLTWFPHKGGLEYIQMILSNNHKPETCKIWLCGSIDAVNWITRSDFYLGLVEERFDISLVGYDLENWHSWFPNALYNNNQNIDTTLTSIKHLYLSYNRKPKPHRFELVQQLIDNNLLSSGYVTYEKGIFPAVDAMTGNTEQDWFEKVKNLDPANYPEHCSDYRFSRPEDIFSLGDLDIWNRSYCIIVSETNVDEKYHLTEKTWKPIIGKRPFVLNTDPSATHVLEKLGFYTPAMLFDFKELDDCNISSIIKLLLKLQKYNNNKLYYLYKKQEPMLEHNYRRFVEIATSDPTKILDCPLFV
jgi:hypothetical protein